MSKEKGKLLIKSAIAAGISTILIDLMLPFTSFSPVPTSSSGPFGVFSFYVTWAAITLAVFIIWKLKLKFFGGKGIV
ncbi:hypothetical protein WB91_21755 [bacteria symbiont BFo1 of Frankliniella occidentalis]|uniref:hypothetical protein n=1 Tax=Erwinia aphidicola TaxID=68334 RepID=UPI000789CAAC|nr:hypothetical protein WB91_21755 [bacteria symbiont BFo1 of Frankliniella occidentalis]